MWPYQNTWAYRREFQHGTHLKELEHWVHFYRIYNVGALFCDCEHRIHYYGNYNWSPPF